MKVELVGFTRQTLVMLRKSKHSVSAMAKLSGVHDRTVRRLRLGDTNKPSAQDIEAIRVVLEQEKKGRSKKKSA